MQAITMKATMFLRRTSLVKKRGELPLAAPLLLSETEVEDILNVLFLGNSTAIALKISSWEG